MYTCSYDAIIYVFVCSHICINIYVPMQPLRVHIKMATEFMIAHGRVPKYIIIILRISSVPPPSWLIPYCTALLLEPS